MQVNAHSWSFPFNFDRKCKISWKRCCISNIYRRSKPSICIFVKKKTHKSLFLGPRWSHALRMAVLVSSSSTVSWPRPHPTFPLNPLTSPHKISFIFPQNFFPSPTTFFSSIAKFRRLHHQILLVDFFYKMPRAFLERLVLVWGLPSLMNFWIYCKLMKPIHF